MPNNLEAKVVFLLDRSEEEIQAIDGHPAVRSASEQIRKALEAATGWRMRKQGGIPQKQFKLAAAFEDALGQLKEAYISATLDTYQDDRAHVLIRGRAKAPGED